MHSINRRNVIVAGAASLALPQVWAQGSYPDHPIHLVHGFGAGGNADTISRLVGSKMEQVLKQPIVIEIKSGAGGMIATEYVSKAAPDGYTLVMLTGGHTASAAMRRTLPYDPVAAFAFLSTVTNFPFVVAVRKEHPAKTFKELMEMAEKEPGKISFSSVGVGSTQHLTGELIASAAKVKLIHVPYRGGGQTVQAVIAGDVDILIDTPTVAVPQVQSGRMRALGVTSKDEWPALPGVPPIATVLPGFVVYSWLGLAAPAGTPLPIVQRLTSVIHQVLKDPDLLKSLDKAGSAAAPNTPNEFRSMVDNDIARWRAVVHKANIPLQG